MFCCGITDPVPITNFRLPITLTDFIFRIACDYSYHYRSRLEFLELVYDWNIFVTNSGYVDGFSTLPMRSNGRKTPQPPKHT